MWKLAIEDDQGHKTVVNLVRDTYSVGRAQENTVRLTERNISRRHAVIRRTGHAWVLEDQASYNGCYVNGVRVADSRELQHGDLVQLGDYRLEVVNESSASEAAGLASPQAVTSPLLPAAQSLTGQPDRFVMVVGPTPGIEYALVGQTLLVGRGEECDISINHSSVSRLHAEIHALGDGRYEIVDRNSANGVRVNGVELQRCMLDARDRIELGDIVLKFIPAGMIYKPGAEESQQIPPNGTITTVPGLTREALVGGLTPTLKLAAIAAVLVGLALVLGVVAFGAARTPSEVPTVGTAAPADDTTRMLADARALALQGQLEAAHARLGGIPETSNARKSQEFQEIEGAWAESLFGLANQESEPARKRDLLDRVAKATTVDSERRKRAADLIAELDTGGVAVNELAKTPAPLDPNAELDSEAGATAMASPRPRVRRDPPGGHGAAPARETQPEAPAVAPKQPSGMVLDAAGSGDRSKQVAAKDSLKAKCSTGACSDQEKRLLRALCRSAGDASCSN